jgi:hypothetical protein
LELQEDPSTHPYRSPSAVLVFFVVYRNWTYVQAQKYLTYAPPHVRERRREAEQQRDIADAAVQEGRGKVREAERQRDAAVQEGRGKVREAERQRDAAAQAERAYRVQAEVLQMFPGTLFKRRWSA